MFGNKNFYAVDCFEPKEKPSSSRAGRRAPISGGSGVAGRKKSNLPPESSPSISNQGSAVKQPGKARISGPGVGNVQNTPPVSRSVQPALKKAGSRVEQS